MAGSEQKQAAEERGAVIEIKDGDRLLGVFMVGWPRRGRLLPMDWLGGIVLHADGSATLSMRFRYHMDELTWGSKDRKSCSRFELPAGKRTPEQLQDLAANLATVLALAPHPVWGMADLAFGSVHPTTAQIIEEWRAQPWTHALESGSPN